MESCSCSIVSVNALYASGHSQTQNIYVCDFITSNLNPSFVVVALYFKRCHLEVAGAPWYKAQRQRDQV